MQLLESFRTFQKLMLTFSDIGRRRGKHCGKGMTPYPGRVTYGSSSSPMIKYISLPRRGSTAKYRYWFYMHSVLRLLSHNLWVTSFVNDAVFYPNMCYPSGVMGCLRWACVTMLYPSGVGGEDIPIEDRICEEGAFSF